MTLIHPDITTGIEVDDATGNQRVLLGRISDPSASNPTGDYGLKVTSSDGTTTIIDGTSNILKIVASGTMNFPDAADGASAENTVDVATGLTYAPAMHVWLDFGSSVASHPITAFDAATGLSTLLRYSRSQVVATNQTRVTFNTTNNVGITFGQTGARYYIMKEAAL